MTYFRMGSPHYHRRAAVSRSCSGWEGVGPAGYGRQALRGESAVLSLVSGTGLEAHHDLGCRVGSVNARLGACGR